MNLKTSLILFAMAAPTAVFAQATENHDLANLAHTKVSVSKYSQEVSQGMGAMHEKMVQGLYQEDSDKAFAHSMIAHHTGAIRMAEAELKHGKDPELHKLAQTIIKVQKEEIKLMEKWLKKVK